MNPPMDARADVQLVIKRDATTDTNTNIRKLRALVESRVSGAISLDAFRSEFYTFFPLDPSEQLDLISDMCANLLVTYEMFQCYIEFTSEDTAALINYLIVACRSGNLEIVRCILEKCPTFIEYLTEEQHLGELTSVPLFWILYESDLNDGVAVAVLDLLLERHPEILCNIRDRDGYSLLHWFARINSPGSVDICRRLIRFFPDLLLEYDNRGCQPLHIACLTGNLGAIECVIEMCPGAINGKSRDGLTPIHFVSVTLLQSPEQALNVTRYLLEVDRDIASVPASIPTFSGRYPLLYVCDGTSASNLNIGFTKPSRPAAWKGFDL